MQSFEFIDLILFLGIGQGVFLATTIQIIQNKNKAANRVLSLILVLSVLILLGRMVFFKFLTAILFQWTIFVDAIIFVFGPLCYIYFRRLIGFKSETFTLSWYHYIPVILHLLFFGYVLSFEAEEFVDRVVLKEFTSYFLGIEGAGIISNFYYWALNNRILSFYIKEEKNTLSYQQDLISFLKLFQITIGVIIIAWAVSFVSNNFFAYKTRFINYNTVWGAISIFIYVVGYYSLKAPELFRISLKNKKSKQQGRVSQDQIQILENKLPLIMEEEKIFLNPYLTLGDLAKKLEVTTHDISWYLNNVLNRNFYDYINHYRIKEFLVKVKNNEHHHQTILAISMDVGFNSKSTFNKAFKLEMNDTPRNYIKQLMAA